MSFFVIFFIGSLGNSIFEPSSLYTWLTAASAVPKREMVDFFSLCWNRVQDAMISSGWKTTDVNSNNKLLLNIEKQYWIVDVYNQQFFGK